MSFSERLKLLRNQKNMTQSKFASKIKVARTTYAMYEQGKREPDYQTLLLIADFHNVTVDYLLGRSNNLTSVKKTSRQLNDLELKDWYTELFKYKKEDLQTLKQIWEIIKE